MIYIVEDDKSIRELLVYTLNNSGFIVTGCIDEHELNKALEKQLPELIILDIMLPGKDGLSILKDLRHSFKTKQIPVIILTANASEYDKVIGLDSGADDYITKPFSMMELISRVKALLRRSKNKKDLLIYTINNIVLNISSHTIIINNKIIETTLKEFELLHLLMKNKGLVLTREMILEHIWGYDFNGETRTIDVHIKTLRSKLGASGKLIETIRGVGYRMGESIEE
jgi:Response regulators consisting of a CheY-like receiver domain and a winged-helix DNA-binding domain